MIHFSTGEMLFSLLYAIAFGVGFFLLFAAVSVLKKQIKRIAALPILLVRYDKILEKPTKNKSRNADEAGAAMTFIFVILFALGFILLSYYALDGCVRIYILLLALVGFILPKGLLYERLFLIFDRIFDLVFYVVTVALRVTVFPFLRLFLHFKTKKYKFKLPFIKK